MNPAMAGNLIPARPPPSRRRWPRIIVGLLVGHTALMITFVVIATRDTSFSVDPDYYGKAIHWDESQARERASAALGWHADLRSEETADANGLRTVTLELTDAAGLPIAGAAVEASYFHHAHGREPHTVSLQADPSDPRQFVARVPMPHAGTWEFHLTARAGERSFVKTLTIEAR